jgi:hypothetical protein
MAPNQKPGAVDFDIISAFWPDICLLALKVTRDSPRAQERPNIVQEGPQTLFGDGLAIDYSSSKRGVGEYSGGAHVTI